MRFRRSDLVIAATEDEKVKGSSSSSARCSSPRPISRQHLVAVHHPSGATDRPAKFMGMRFANPVPVMQLVELIRASPPAKRPSAQFAA
jgi:hypothetical protein